MSIRDAVYGLLRSGYSLADGIEVKRRFLDSLVQGRKLQESEKSLFYKAYHSNFLGDPVIYDALHPRRQYAAYAGLFGSRAKTVRQKTKSLSRQEKDITNIILRSLANGEFTGDARDLNVGEYQKFISTLQRDYVDSKSPKKRLSFDKVAFDLMGCNSFSTIDKLLSKEEVYPSKKFYKNVLSHSMSPQLRKNYIQYHADTLELMVDIVQYLFEAAERNGFTISPDYKPRIPELSRGWKDEFGENLPAITKLIDESRQSLQRAKKFLQP